MTESFHLFKCRGLIYHYLLFSKEGSKYWHLSCTSHTSWHFYNQQMLIFSAIFAFLQQTCFPAPFWASGTGTYPRLFSRLDYVVLCWEFSACSTFMQKKKEMINVLGISELPSLPQLTFTKQNSTASVINAMDCFAQTSVGHIISWQRCGKRGK